MAAPHDPQSRVAFPHEGRIVAAASGVIALGLTIAALVATFQSPYRMLLITLLYVAALATAITGEWFRRAWDVRSNGLKMVILLAVLGCLISLSVWTVLDTWSVIGKCERHEEQGFFPDDTRVWYEGTACTEEELEGRLY